MTVVDLTTDPDDYIYSDITAALATPPVGYSSIFVVHFVPHDEFEVRVKWYFDFESTYSGVNTTISAGTSVTLLLLAFRDASGNLSLSVL